MQDDVKIRLQRALFWGGFALAVCFVLWLAFPPLGGAGHQKYQDLISCRNNLKELGLAAIIYAGDDPEKGYFPSGDSFALLEELGYLEDGKHCACPAAGRPSEDSGRSDFVYLGAGLKDNNAAPTKVIIAHDRIGNHKGWVNCLYLDGHTRACESKARTWEDFRVERAADGDLMGGVPADGGMALDAGAERN
jgi:prepilin-type processing-associated H-X9-DG protein